MHMLTTPVCVVHNTSSYDLYYINYKDNYMCDTTHTTVIWYLYDP